MVVAIDAQLAPVGVTKANRLEERKRPRQFTQNKLRDFALWDRCNVGISLAESR
jgi:hypothetical protein